MTRKVITLEFVVSTLVSVVLSIGAVYLINCYLGPVDQSDVYASGDP